MADEEAEQQQPEEGTLQMERYKVPDEEEADQAGIPRQRKVTFLGMAGAYQNSRKLKYQEQKGDWIDSGWYQFCVLITHTASWTALILALIELSVQSPSTIAMDFYEFPGETWRFVTILGMSGWTGLIAVNFTIWILWFIVNAGKACANRSAVHYQAFIRDEDIKSRVTLPYPPLRMSVTWTFIVMLFWAGDLGWAGDIMSMSSTTNVVVQMAWFNNLMWFTIVSSVFTSLEYTNRVSRWILDSLLWCGGSHCFDC